MKNIKLNLKSKEMGNVECVGVLMSNSNYQDLLTKNILFEKKLREQNVLIDKLKMENEKLEKQNRELTFANGKLASASINLNAENENLKKQNQALTYKNQSVYCKLKDVQAIINSIV